MAEESKKERIDREVIELLNELRVTLPGVQVLFAFLLVVPFQQGFQQVTDLERFVFLLSFLATTLATVLLIAPASYHRLRFREGDKERMLLFSNRLVIAGLVTLVVAMTSAVFLITEVVFGDLVAAFVAAVGALVFAVFWFGIPLYAKARDDRGA